MPPYSEDKMAELALLEPVIEQLTPVEEQDRVTLEYSEIPWPDISHIITDDGAPVDNLLTERNMRLLTDALYTSWKGPGDNRPFLTYANVGLFFSVSEPPLVPDVLLSLDVAAPREFIGKDKYRQSYFVWYFGKPPDVVIEIVSNKVGREEGFKRRKYAQLGIAYYIVFDPDHHLNREILRVYELRGRQYEQLEHPWLSAIGLGLTLWPADYQGSNATWLRWVDADNKLLLTGAELAEQERTRAEQERTRADVEHSLVEKLMAQLRMAGIEPEL